MAIRRHPGNREQLPCGKEEFARLRDDEPLVRKLMLELDCSARRQNTNRVVEIQTDRDVTRSAADIDRRGDDCRRENAQVRRGGKLNAHASEIERQCDGASGLKQRQLRRAANVDFAAGRERESRLARVDSYDVAVRDENARRDRCSARSGRNASLDRNVVAFDAAESLRRPLLCRQTC